MIPPPQLYTLYGQPRRHWRSSGYVPLVEPIVLVRNLTWAEAEAALVQAAARGEKVEVR